MRRPGVGVFLAVAVVLSTACSDDGGPAPDRAPAPADDEDGSQSGDGTTTTATVAAGREIVLSDFTFSPAVLEVPSGAVALSLENTGSVVHTFTAEALGIDQELAPGATASVVTIPPATGDLAFYCRFHRDAGMEGTLRVTS